ncbi:hypothetical protein QTL95_18310 [Rhizobium sp. S152]|uniref:hypothetical protein n=1 Tax=Rhizobium sp. S152 TaxID=3055038 RepID=UPI0025A993DA|nr:hypothetical protein [Rhizobium sp. S152]MDM9627848.1 hypothetical protein [Rhizobium sp. S152]
MTASRPFEAASIASNSPLAVAFARLVDEIPVPPKPETTVDLETGCITGVKVELLPMRTETTETPCDFARTRVRPFAPRSVQA